jgi:F0F1-type ATP synthase assembly protein I
MSTYDPTLLRTLADKLNAQARTAVVVGIIAGAITGGLFGFAASLIFMTSHSYLVPGAVVGAVLGVFAGRRKAQALRLQAQMALCQVQIEENTRLGRRG